MAINVNGGGSIPQQYPTEVPTDGAPLQQTGVEGGAQAEGASDVQQAPGGPTTPPPKDVVTTEGPKLTLTKQDAPPGFDPQAFQQKIDTAYAAIDKHLSPEQAAVAKTNLEALASTISNNPDIQTALVNDKNGALFLGMLAGALSSPQVMSPEQVKGEFTELLAKGGGVPAGLVEGGPLAMTASGAGALPNAPGGATPRSGTLPSGLTEGGPMNLTGTGGPAGTSTANLAFSAGGPSGTPEVINATNWAVLGDMGDGDIQALAFLVMMQASKSAQEDLKAIMAGVKSINNAKARQRELLSGLQQLSAKFASKTGGQKIGNSISQSDLNGLFTGSGANQTGANKTGGNLVVNGAIVTPGDPTNPKGFKEEAKYQLNGNFTKAELDSLVDRAKSDLDSMSEMGEMESLRLQMAMDRMSKMMSTLSNLLKKISDTQNGIVQNLK